MEIRDQHPSDEEMLAYADGELPSRRAATVRAHLGACWVCRGRIAEIEGGIREFLEAYRTELDGRLPPPAGPRALLKAQLKALPKPGTFGMGPQLAAGLCAAALSIFGALLLSRPARLAGDAVAVPKASLTPGDTLPLTRTGVCQMPGDQLAELVPVSVRQTVLRRYGIENARPDAYEIDYLITPGLGGSGDVRNLWPEPYTNTVWNAHVKDALENRLHDLVCGGTLDLGTAQRELATDWISAYKKYFHTTTPIAR